MAVNLSFRQFQDSQLLPTLQRLIEEHGVDARWLEFELTETAVMRRSDQVLQTMQALGQLGVRFRWTTSAPVSRPSSTSIACRSPC